MNRPAGNGSVPSNGAAASRAVDAPVLAAHGVDVSFGGVRALDGVSLSVPGASIVGLIGPNGAGKSTLFGVLSGMLRADHGRVELEGADVTGWSPARRARHGLARTFQRPELFDELSVRQHLALAYRTSHNRPRLLRDLVWPERRGSASETELIDRLCDQLGLTDVRGIPATTLPLGTSRLVELGRALVTNPRVVLLDEPSASLSGAETDRLAGVLRRLPVDQGVAVVLVEHDVELVLSLAESVTVLDTGQVIAAGPPAAIRDDPRVREAYLGVEA